MDYRKHRTSRFWLHFISAPFIWLPLPFIILLDLVTSLYQVICFPIYKIDYVKRSEYILILDRNKLAYLNPLEKIGCMYCGYSNGLFLYLKEVAGRTEKYWCGIMHEGKPGFKVQTDQTKQKFAAYGDEQDFKSKYHEVK
ncbi:MAG: hypothetical protein WCK37_02550 [Candidatus Falkowbacteria bacterium]